MNLKKCLGEEKRWVRLSIILIISTITIQSLRQIVFANLIDSLVQFSAHTFWFWILMMGLSSLVTIVFSQSADYVRTKTIQKINLALQKRLAIGVSNLSYTKFHEEGSVGKFTSWLTNDVQQIDAQGFENFFNIVMYAAGVVVPFFTFAYYHWILALTALILGITLQIVPKSLTKNLQKNTLNVTLTNEEFVQRVENILQGFDTLSAFHCRQQIVKKIGLAAEKVKNDTLAYKRSEIKIDLITNSFSVLSQVILIGLAGYLVLTQQLTAGVLMTVGTLAGIIFTSISQLAGLLVKIHAVDPIFEKYQTVDLQEKEEEKVTRGIAASLTLDKVAAKDGETIWLRSTSAAILPMAKVHVTGLSGQGKSTLMRIIAGLNPTFQGSLSWQPQVPTILYLPQTPHIFNESIRYNLTLGKKVTDEKLWQALTTVFLKETVEKLPQQLDTVLTAGGGDLSGGQRQRLALARALLVETDVLLLDESTANVDPETAVKITKTFLEQSKMIFYVAHQEHPEIAELFSQKISL